MKISRIVHQFESYWPAFRTTAQMLAVTGLLCLGMLLVAVGTAPAAGCLDRYLVRSGDSLTGIASRYGFDWMVIANLNSIEAPFDIYAGQWLCLPAVVGAEAAAATPHPSRLPGFTVKISGKWVQIQTHNFPAKNSYAVRIAENLASSEQVWSKIGILRTKKGGEIKSRFELPMQLKHARQLMICLKNTSTDVMSCQVVYIWR